MTLWFLTLLHVKRHLFVIIMIILVVFYRVLIYETVKHNFIHVSYCAAHGPWHVMFVCMHNLCALNQIYIDRLLQAV